MGIELYQDQMELVQELREVMRRILREGRRKSILVQAATGAGKSVISAFMIASSRAKKTRSAFVVPRKELLKQMADTFSKFHIPHSYVAAGNPFNQHSYTHICSAMSLINRLDHINPQVVFIDETHFGTGALETIINYYLDKGAWVIGLSATPMKMSGQGLEDWYEEMVCGKSIRWLIDNKRLSEYRGFAPSHVDLQGMNKSGGDYARGQLDDKMSDNVIIGDAVKHYKEHAAGLLNIAFCAGIKSSQLTAERFRAEGVIAVHVDGKTSSSDLRQIMRDYATHQIEVLTNSDLLTFGFDLASNAGMPVNVQCISDLRPTTSLPLQLQKWGRGLRYDGDTHLMFDHANNFEKHGLPCDEREWTLASHEAGSRDPYEITVDVRQCPVCYRCHEPGPKCPSCGYEYPPQSREIEEIEGDLVEIERERKREVKKRKKVAKAKRVEKNREMSPGDKEAARHARRKHLKAKGYSHKQIYFVFKGEGVL